ncbi:MAG: hypothetical protein JWM76_617 [Pseudonocardiales bacterium]|nr:hypothetical protein [Pseudonocardiales bacterium]
MVGDLEHIGPQIGPALQQPPLRLGRGIAGQQDPVPSHRCPHNERGVVRIRLAVDIDDVGREYVQNDAAGCDLITDRCDLSPDAQWTQRVFQLGASTRRSEQRPGQHQPDPPPADDPGDATHMVLVQVCLHVDKHPGDTE